MKRLITLLTIITSLQVCLAGTSAKSQTATQLKSIATAIESDSQNYFQNGEMSVLLANQVEKIMAHNSKISVDEAVTVALEVAHLHN